MSQPLCKLPNLEKAFEFHCDALGDSIDVVLSQEVQPIAYESRQLHTK